MSQSHRIKGGTTDEAFQERRLQCERRASVDVNLDLFNFQEFYMTKNLRIFVCLNQLNKQTLFLSMTESTEYTNWP